MLLCKILRKLVKSCEVDKYVDHATFVNDVMTKNELGQDDKDKR